MRKCTICKTWRQTSRLKPLNIVPFKVICKDGSLCAHRVMNRDEKRKSSTVTSVDWGLGNSTQAEGRFNRKSGTVLYKS